MERATAARLLVRYYSRIYHACHRRHVRDESAGREVSAGAVSVLDHLDSVAVTFVSDLARHMGVTASTMSLALDRLESGGYVARERDAEDGRKVGVKLTAAGEKLRRASSVLDPELVVRLVGLLGVEDRRRAIEGLELLSKAAEGMSGDAAMLPGRAVRPGRSVKS